MSRKPSGNIPKLKLGGFENLNASYGDDEGNRAGLPTTPRSAGRSMSNQSSASYASSTSSSSVPKTRTRSSSGLRRETTPHKDERINNNNNDTTTTSTTTEEDNTSTTTASDDSQRHYRDSRFSPSLRLSSVEEEDVDSKMQGSVTANGFGRQQMQNSGEETGSGSEGKPPARKLRPEEIKRVPRPRGGIMGGASPRTTGGIITGGFGANKKNAPPVEQKKTNQLGASGLMNLFVPPSREEKSKANSSRRTRNRGESVTSVTSSTSSEDSTSPGSLRTTENRYNSPQDHEPDQTALSDEESSPSLKRNSNFKGFGRNSPDDNSQSDSTSSSKHTSISASPKPEDHGVVQRNPNFKGFGKRKTEAESESPSPSPSSPKPEDHGVVKRNPNFKGFGKKKTSSPKPVELPALDFGDSTSTTSTSSSSPPKPSDHGNVQRNPNFKGFGKPKTDSPSASSPSPSPKADDHGNVQRNPNFKGFQRPAKQKQSPQPKIESPAESPKPEDHGVVKRNPNFKGFGKKKKPSPKPVELPELDFGESTTTTTTTTSSSTTPSTTSPAASSPKSSDHGNVQRNPNFKGFQRPAKQKQSPQPKIESPAESPKPSDHGNVQRNPNFKGFGKRKTESPSPSSSTSSSSPKPADHGNVQRNPNFKGFGKTPSIKITSSDDNDGSPTPSHSSNKSKAEDHGNVQRNPNFKGFGKKKKPSPKPVELPELDFGESTTTTTTTKITSTSSSAASSPKPSDHGNVQRNPNFKGFQKAKSESPSSSPKSSDHGNVQRNPNFKGFTKKKNKDTTDNTPVTPKLPRPTGRPSVTSLETSNTIDSGTEYNQKQLRGIDALSSTRTASLFSLDSMSSSPASSRTNTPGVSTHVSRSDRRSPADGMYDDELQKTKAKLDALMGVRETVYHELEYITGEHGVLHTLQSDHLRHSVELATLLKFVTNAKTAVNQLHSQHHELLKLIASMSTVKNAVQIKAHQILSDVGVDFQQESVKTDEINSLASMISNRISAIMDYATSSGASHLADSIVELHAQCEALATTSLFLNTQLMEKSANSSNAAETAQLLENKLQATRDEFSNCVDHLKQTVNKLLSVTGERDNLVQMLNQVMKETQSLQQDETTIHHLFEEYDGHLSDAHDALIRFEDMGQQLEEQVSGMREKYKKLVRAHKRVKEDLESEKERNDMEQSWSQQLNEQLEAEKRISYDLKKRVSKLTEETLELQSMISRDKQFSTLSSRRTSGTLSKSSSMHSISAFASSADCEDCLQATKLIGESALCFLHDSPEHSMPNSTQMLTPSNVAHQLELTTKVEHTGSNPTVLTVAGDLISTSWSDTHGRKRKLATTDLPVVINFDIQSLSRRHTTAAAFSEITALSVSPPSSVHPRMASGGAVAVNQLREAYKQLEAFQNREIALEEEIVALTDVNERLHDHLMATKKEFTVSKMEHEAKVRHIHQQLVRSQRLLRDQQMATTIKNRDLSRAQNQVESDAEVLRALESRIENLERLKRIQDEKLSTANEEISIRDDKIASLQGDLDQQTKTSSDESMQRERTISNSEQSFKQQMEHLQSMLDEARKAQTDVQQTLDHVSEQNTNLEEANKTLQMDMENMRLDNAKKLDELKEKLNTVVAEKDKLFEEKNELGSRATTAIQEKENAVLALQSRKRQFEEMENANQEYTDQLQQELVDLRTKQMETEQSMVEETKRAHDLKKQLEALQESHASLEQISEQKSKDATVALQTELTELQKQNELLDSQLEKWKDSHDEVQQDLTQERARLTKLDDEVIQLRKSVASLTEQLETAHNQQQGLAQEDKSHQQQANKHLADLQQQLQQLQQHVDSLNRTNANLEQQKNVYKTALLEQLDQDMAPVPTQDDTAESHIQPTDDLTHSTGCQMCDRSITLLGVRLLCNTHQIKPSEEINKKETQNITSLRRKSEIRFTEPMLFGDDRTEDANGLQRKTVVASPQDDRLLSGTHATSSPSSSSSSSSPSPSTVDDTDLDDLMSFGASTVHSEESESDNLRKEMVVLKARLNETTIQLEAINSNEATIRQQLEQEKQNSEQLQSQLDELRSQEQTSPSTDVSQEKLESLQTQLNASKELCDQLQQEAAERKTSQEKLREKISTLETQNRESESQKKSLAKQIKDSNENARKLQIELTKLQTQAEQQSKVMIETSQDLSTQKSKANDLEKQIIQLEQQRKALENNAKSFKSLTAEKEKLVEKLQQELLDVKQNLQGKENELEQAKSHQASKEQDLAALKKSNKEWEEKYNKTFDETKNLERSILRTKKNATSLQQTVDKMKEEHKQAIETLETEIKAQKLANDKLKSITMSTRPRVASIDMIEDGNETEDSGIRPRSDTLGTSTVSDESKALKLQLKQKGDEIKTLNRRCEQLQKQADVAEQTCHELMSQLEDHRIHQSQLKDVEKQQYQRAETIMELFNDNSGGKSPRLRGLSVESRYTGMATSPSRRSGNQLGVGKSHELAFDTLATFVENLKTTMKRKEEMYQINIREKNSTLSQRESEIEELKGQVKHLDVDFSKVSERVSELEAKVESKESIIVGLRTNKKSLEEELSQTKEQLSSKVNEFDQLKLRLKSSVDESQEYQQLSEGAEMEQKRMLKQLERLSKDRNRLQEEIDVLQTENAKHRQAEKEMEEKLHIEQSNVRESERKLGAAQQEAAHELELLKHRLQRVESNASITEDMLSKEKERTKNSIEEMTRKNAEWIEKLEEKSHKIAELMGENEELRTNVKGLEKTKTQLTESMESLRNDIKNRDKKLETVSSLVKAKEQEGEGLKQAVEKSRELEQKIKSLEMDLTEMEMERNEAKRTAKDAALKVETLEGQVESMNARTKRLNAQVFQFTEDVNKLEAQVRVQKNRSSELENTIHEMEMKNGHLKEALEAANQRVNSGKEMQDMVLAQIKQQYAKAQLQNEELSATVSERNKSIDELERLNRTVTGDLRKKVHEISEIEEEAELTLKRERTSWRREKQTLEQELAEMQAEVQRMQNSVRRKEEEQHNQARSLDNLMASKKELSVKIESMETKMQDLQAVLERTVGEKQKVENDYAELEKSADGIRQELKSEHKQLEKAQKSIQEETDRAETIGKELKQAREASEAMKKINESLNAAVERFKADSMHWKKEYELFRGVVSGALTMDQVKSGCAKCHQASEALGENSMCGEHDEEFFEVVEGVSLLDYQALRPDVVHTSKIVGDVRPLHTGEMTYIIPFIPDVGEFMMNRPISPSIGGGRSRSGSNASRSSHHSGGRGSISALVSPGSSNGDSPSFLFNSRWEDVRESIVGTPPKRVMSRSNSGKLMSPSTNSPIAMLANQTRRRGSMISRSAMNSAVQETNKQFSALQHMYSRLQVENRELKAEHERSMAELKLEAEQAMNDREESIQALVAMRWKYSSAEKQKSVLLVENERLKRVTNQVRLMHSSHSVGGEVLLSTVHVLGEQIDQLAKESHQHKLETGKLNHDLQIETHKRELLQQENQILRDSLVNMQRTRGSLKADLQNRMEIEKQSRHRDALALVRETSRSQAVLLSQLQHERDELSHISELLAKESMSGTKATVWMCKQLENREMEIKRLHGEIEALKVHSALQVELSEQSRYESRMDRSMLEKRVAQGLEQVRVKDLLLGNMMNKEMRLRVRLGEQVELGDRMNQQWNQERNHLAAQLTATTQELESQRNINSQLASEMEQQDIRHAETIEKMETTTNTLHQQLEEAQKHIKQESDAKKQLHAELQSSETTIDQLNQTIATRDQQVRQMNDEWQRKQHQSETVVRNQLGVMDKLRGELQTCKQELDQAHQSLNEQQHVNQQQQQRLKEMEDAQNTLQQTKKQVETEMATLQQAHRAMENLVGRLRAAVKHEEGLRKGKEAELQSSISQNNQQVDEQRNRTETQKQQHVQEMQKRDHREAEMQTQLKELQEKLRQESHKLEQIQREKGDIETLKSGLEGEKQQMATWMEGAMEERRALEEQLFVLGTERNGLVERVTDMDRVIVELGVRMEGLEHEKESLKEQTRELKMLLATREKELSEEKEGKRDREAKLTSMTENHQRLDFEHAKIVRELEERERMVRDLEREREGRQRDLMDRERELSEVRREKETLGSQLSGVDRERSQWRKDREDQERTEEKLKKEVEQLIQENSGLQNVVRELDARLNRALEEIGHRETERLQLAQQLADEKQTREQIAEQGKTAKKETHAVKQRLAKEQKKRKAIEKEMEESMNWSGLNTSGRIGSGGGVGGMSMLGGSSRREPLIVQQMRELENEVEERTTRLNTVTMELEKLRQEKEVRSEMKEKLEREHGEMKSEHKQVLEERRGLEVELGVIRNERDRLLQEVEAVNGRATKREEELKERIDALEEGYGEIEEERDSIREQLGLTQRQYQEERSQWIIQKDYEQELEKRVENWTLRIRDMEKRNTVLETANRSLAQQLQSSRSEIDVMQQRIQQEEARMDKQFEENRELLKGAVETKQSLVKAKEELEKGLIMANSELQLERQQGVQIRSMLEESEKEREQLLNQRDELQQQVQPVREENQHLKQQVGEMSTQLERLALDWQNVKQRNEDLEQLRHVFVNARQIGKIGERNRSKGELMKEKFGTRMADVGKRMVDEQRGRKHAEETVQHLQHQLEQVSKEKEEWRVRVFDLQTKLEEVKEVMSRVTGDGSTDALVLMREATPRCGRCANALMMLGEPYECNQHRLMRDMEERVDDRGSDEHRMLWATAELQSLEERDDWRMTEKTRSTGVCKVFAVTDDHQFSGHNPSVNEKAFAIRANPDQVNRRMESRKIAAFESVVGKIVQDNERLNELLARAEQKSLGLNPNWREIVRVSHEQMSILRTELTMQKLEVERMQEWIHGEMEKTMIAHGKFMVHVVESGTMVNEGVLRGMPMSGEAVIGLMELSEYLSTELEDRERRLDIANAERAMCSSELTKCQQRLEQVSQKEAQWRELCHALEQEGLDLQDRINGHVDLAVNVDTTMEVFREGRRLVEERKQALAKSARARFFEEEAASMSQRNRMMQSRVEGLSMSLNGEMMKMGVNQRVKEAMEGDLNETRYALKMVREELVDVEREKRQLDAQVRELETKTRLQTEREARDDVERQRLWDRNRELVDEMSKEIREKRDLEDSVTRLTRELDTLREREVGQQQHSQALESRVEQLQKRLTEVQTQSEEFARKREAESERQLAELDAAWQDRIEREYVGPMEEAEEIVMQMSVEKTELVREKENLERELRLVNREISDREEQARRALQSSSIAHGREETLGRELQRQKESREAIEIEFKKREKEMDRLKREIDRRDRDIETLNRQHDRYEQRVQELEERQRQLVKSGTGAVEEKADMLERMNKLNEEMFEAQQKEMMAREGEKEAKKQLEVVRQLLQESERLKEEAEEWRNGFSGVETQLKQRVQEAETRAVMDMEARARVELERNQLKETIAILESEKMRLQLDREQLEKQMQHERRHWNSVEAAQQQSQRDRWTKAEDALDGWKRVRKEIQAQGTGWKTRQQELEQLLENERQLVVTTKRQLADVQIQTESMESELMRCKEELQTSERERLSAEQVWQEERTKTKQAWESEQNTMKQELETAQQEIERLNGRIEGYDAYSQNVEMQFQDLSEYIDSLEDELEEFEMREMEMAMEEQAEPEEYESDSADDNVMKKMTRSKSVVHQQINGLDDKPKQTGRGRTSHNVSRGFSRGGSRNGSRSGSKSASRRSSTTISNQSSRHHSNRNSRRTSSIVKPPTTATVTNRSRQLSTDQLHTFFNSDEEEHGGELILDHLERSQSASRASSRRNSRVDSILSLTRSHSRVSNPDTQRSRSSDNGSMVDQFVLDDQRREIEELNGIIRELMSTVNGQERELEEQRERHSDMIAGQEKLMALNQGLAKRTEELEQEWSRRLREHNEGRLTAEQDNLAAQQTMRELESEVTRLVAECKRLSDLNDGIEKTTFESTEKRFQADLVRQETEGTNMGNRLRVYEVELEGKRREIGEYRVEIDRRDQQLMEKDRQIEQREIQNKEQSETIHSLRNQMAILQEELEEWQMKWKLRRQDGGIIDLQMETPNIGDGMLGDLLNTRQSRDEVYETEIGQMKLYVEATKKNYESLVETNRQILKTLKEERMNNERLKIKLASVGGVKMTSMTMMEKENGSENGRGIEFMSDQEQEVDVLDVGIGSWRVGTASGLAEQQLGNSSSRMLFGGSGIKLTTVGSVLGKSEGKQPESTVRPVKVGLGNLNADEAATVQENFAQMVQIHLKHKEEIEELRQTVSQGEREKMEMLNVVEGMQHAFEEQTDECRALKGQLEQLNAERETMTQEHQRLERETGLMRRKLQIVDDEIAGVKRVSEEYKAAMERMATELKKAQASGEGKKRMLIQMEGKLIASQERIAEMGKKEMEMDEILERLAEVRKREANLQVSAVQVETFKERMKMYRDAAEEADGKVEQLESEVARLQTEVDRLGHRSEKKDRKLQKQLEEIEVLRAVQEELEVCRQTLWQTERNVEESNRMVEQKQIQVVEKQQEVDKREQELEQLRGRIDTLQEQLNKESQARERAEWQKEELLALKEQAKTVPTLQQEIQELNHVLEMERKERASVQSALDSTTEQLQGVQSSIEEANANLHEAKTLQNKFTGLEGERQEREHVMQRTIQELNERIQEMERRSIDEKTEWMTERKRMESMEKRAIEQEKLIVRGDEQTRRYGDEIEKLGKELQHMDGEVMEWKRRYTELLQMVEGMEMGTEIMFATMEEKVKELEWQVKGDDVKQEEFEEIWEETEVEEEPTPESDSEEAEPSQRKPKIVKRVVKILVDKKAYHQEKTRRAMDLVRRLSEGRSSVSMSDLGLHEIVECLVGHVERLKNEGHGLKEDLWQEKMERIRKEEHIVGQQMLICRLKEEQRETVKEMMNAIRTMGVERRRVEDGMLEARKQREASVTRQQQLEVDTASCERHLQELEAMLASEEQAKQQVEEERRVTQAEVEHLEQQILQAQERIGMQQRERSEIELQLKEQSDVCTRLQVEKQQVEEEMEGLRREVEAERRDMQSHLAEVEVYEKQRVEDMNQMKETVAALERALESTTGDRQLEEEANVTAMGELMEQMVEWKTRCMEAEQEVAKRQNEWEAMERTVKESDQVAKRLEEVEASLAQERESGQETERVGFALKQEVERLRQEWKQESGRAQKLEQEVEKERGQHERLEREGTELRELIEKHGQEASKMEKELERLRKEQHSWQERERQWKAAETELKRNAVGQEGQVERLKREMEWREQTAEEMKQKAEEALASLKKREVTIEGLQMELLEEKAKRREAEVEWKVSTDTLTRVRSELNEAEEHAKKMELESLQERESREEAEKKMEIVLAGEEEKQKGLERMRVEINELKSQQREFVRQEQEMKGQLTSGEEERGRLEKKVHKLQKELKERMEEGSSMEKRVQELEELMSEENQKGTQQGMELEATRERERKLEVELGELKERLSETELERDGLRKDREEGEKRYRESLEEMKRHSEEREERVKRDMKLMEEEVNGVEERQKEWEETRIRLEQEVERLKQENEEWKGHGEEWENNGKEWKAERKEQKKREKVLQKEVKSGEKKLREKEEEHGVIKRELEKELEKKSRELEAEKRISMGGKEASKEMKKREAEREKLLAHVEFVEGEIRRLHGALQAAGGENEELKKKMRKMEERGEMRRRKEEEEEEEESGDEGEEEEEEAEEEDEDSDGGGEGSDEEDDGDDEGNSEEDENEDEDEDEQDKKRKKQQDKKKRKDKKDKKDKKKKGKKGKGKNKSKGKKKRKKKQSHRDSDDSSDDSSSSSSSSSNDGDHGGDGNAGAWHDFYNDDYLAKIEEARQASMMLEGMGFSDAGSEGSRHSARSMRSVRSMKSVKSVRTVQAMKEGGILSEEQMEAVDDLMMEQEKLEEEIERLERDNVG